MEKIILLDETLLAGSHCPFFEEIKIFLKWQPCHFAVMVFCFVYVNLLRLLLMFFYKLASCPIPYFNQQLLFIENCLALALNSCEMFTFTVPQDSFFGLSR